VHSRFCKSAIKHFWPKSKFQINKASFLKIPDNKIKSKESKKKIQKSIDNNIQ